MKYSRLIIGIAAVIFALWVIIGEQMSGASADAVVNAPVVTVRAPVAGNLELPTRQLGVYVRQGEVLATIADPIVDRVHLDDLLMEVQLEKAGRDQIVSLLTETRTIHDSMQQRTDTYRTHRLEELRERLSRAEARLAILENGGVPRTAAQQRAVDAVTEESDRLPAEPNIASLVLEHARERVAVLQIAVNAAEQNVFLGDGYNDAPNAEQHMVQLDGEIADMVSRKAEADARVAAIEERVDRARVSVNSLTGGELRSPVTGTYWEILEANGTNVQRGDPLLRLVDCSATVVTLSVTERVYNGLTIGQGAKFRLGGASDVYDATVSRLAGSGAETVYRNLAVAPSRLHLERYDVTLIVPGLRDKGTDGCLIGRTGRAFFDTRPLDGLRNLFH
ncbi:HlyD family secretion protein [Paracoccus sp. JM45]|uniref:HlyD family secretion protein n=1 Tax=Paracoccus sp. JM45 TaxID=2283626 RepID=UPI000E6CF05F|nr:HlyD family efflux transporter periplasmic adaptor subunit [Paracoccus sp. JM45]RJE78504.1 HlyD family efflux transporter periplasmic adaptor subunit [Paracoccus sp. JM45]